MKITIKFDANGNKKASIPGNEAGRGFSIQTNGSLPLCHRLLKGVHCLNKCQTAELAEYISQYGTEVQKRVIETNLK